MRKILPKDEMQSRRTKQAERPPREYSTMIKFKSRGAILWLEVLWLGLAMPAGAQYPGHVETAKKAAPAVRAIAVVEWTGQTGKPSASRIIPISVFDGEQYQPGGLYLAKPQPLALEPGTEYVLQDAGVARGLFDVNTAQDVDGYWFGYGAWKPMTSPPKRAKPKQGRNMPQVVRDAGDGRPHFKNSSPGGGQDSSASNGSSSQSSAPPSASDPDRPTLRRRPDSPASAANDSPADTKAPETAIAEPDPDRPHIAHGQQSMSDDFQPPQLTGVPSDLQQIIAVSDAGDRESHPFVYLWADPGDATKMQAQMEAAASDAIAASQPAKAAVKPAAKAHATTTATQHRKAAAAPSPKFVFTNQHFKAYELTYSGGATLVFSAETVDQAGKVKYVTLIAQPDFNGVPKVLFKSVTDDDHLDQKPKMRLVDAVDARADNRGDLIFELRSTHDREFVIYKISGGLAEQVFTTGSLPNSQS
jgi:hypothetical protein